AQSHSGGHEHVLRQESGMVEATRYARQSLVVEPGGDPHPCVQTLLPEEGVLEESGGIQDACPGFVAGIQSSVRPPLRVDVDESEDAAMVRETYPEFIAGFVSGDTSRSSTFI